MRIIFRISIMLGVLIVAGCGANTPNVVNPLDSTPSSVTTPLPNTAEPEIATPDRMDPNMAKTPERVPTGEAITPIKGEVPKELLESIVMDLAARTGAVQTTINVIHDQQVVWNDGSLGCPKPGELYTQSLVNGYWVLLELNGKQYDYRATATGYFFLCERGIPPGPPSTPNS